MQGAVFNSVFILLKDKENAEKATRLFGVPVPRQWYTTPCCVLKGELVAPIPPGERVQRKDCQMPHNYRTLTKDTPATFYLNEDEFNLSPLSPNDFDVLAGIKSTFSRFQFFVERGRLDWATKLKKGDKVLVEVPIPGGNTAPPKVSAVIRHVGPVQTLLGATFGVEIKDQIYFGWGTSNGFFRDKQYFRCKEDCGLFVSAEKIFPVAPLPAGSPEPAQKHGGKRSPRTRLSFDNHSGFQYKIGDGVVVFTKKGDPVHGTVKWVGIYSFTVSKKTYSHKSVGIETNVKLKTSEVEGFPIKSGLFVPAKDRGAVFLSEDEVLPEADFAEGKALVQGSHVGSKERELLREAIKEDPDQVTESVQPAAIAREAGIQTEMVRQDAAARRQMEQSKQEEEDQRRREEMKEIKQAVSDQSLDISGQERMLRQISDERRRVGDQIAGGRGGGRSNVGTEGERRWEVGGRGEKREGEMRPERRESGHMLQKKEHIYDTVGGGSTGNVLHHQQYGDWSHRQNGGARPAVPYSQGSTGLPSTHHQMGSSYPHSGSPRLSHSAEQHNVPASPRQPTNPPPHPGQGRAYVDHPQPTPVLDVGSPVELVHDSSRHGVVRWLGTLPAIQGFIAGVELDGPMEGCGNGEWKGHRYFTCLPGRGFFCPITSLKPDPRIPQIPSAVKHAGNSSNPWQIALQVQKYQESRGLPIERTAGEAGLLIADLQETGRTLGTGSYGEVVEVQVRGRRCAAKKLHGVFTLRDVQPKEKSAITERFKTECRRVLYLSHPNIIEMIGIHFDPATQLPTLVMELMDTSLCKYLENNSKSSVPLSIKYSILHDMASGLVYLHSLPPPLGPIVHRDLTANNILLAVGRGVVAKIADLGQAKIDSKYATRQQQLSQVPGNDDHMPPEAWVDNPVYDASLDVFSFGVVILHTLTHKWPKPLARFKSYTEVRLEVDRRKEYLDKISESPLKPLVVQCLSQKPGDRPSTSDIFHVLERHNIKHANPMMTVPAWEEQDQTIAGDQIVKYTGERRGIQGHHNSCYLDATIFGLFALSDVFDSLFLDHMRSLTSLQSPTPTSPIQKEVGAMLWKGIVNPLRKNGAVRYESVMRLRNKLEELGKMEGVNTKEKDPKEFLNMLFKHTLHVDPFITIKRPSGTEPEFFVQLFVELDKSLKVPTIEKLLMKMFKEQHISFSEIPSKLLVQVSTCMYGKEFQIYKRIIPGIKLDPAPLVDGQKTCFNCGEPASNYCTDCKGDYNAEGMMVHFCDHCNGLVHKHPARVGHRPEREEFPELELLSVLCIETSHYVCFSRDSEGRWLFFDSMADRLYDQFNIPRGVECTAQLNKWVYEGDQERLMAAGPRELPELVRRFTEDVYMCVYIQPDYGMYG